MTSTSGVRVLIHPQSAFPFPEDVGLDVSVGVTTSIGLRKVRRPRGAGTLPEPRLLLTPGSSREPPGATAAPDPGGTRFFLGLAVPSAVRGTLSLRTRALPARGHYRGEGGGTPSLGALPGESGGTPSLGALPGGGRRHSQPGGTAGGRAEALPAWGHCRGEGGDIPSLGALPGGGRRHSQPEDKESPGCCRWVPRVRCTQQVYTCAPCVCCAEECIIRALCRGVHHTCAVQRCASYVCCAEVCIICVLCRGVNHVCCRCASCVLQVCIMCVVQRCASCVLCAACVHHGCALSLVLQVSISRLGGKFGNCSAVTRDVVRNTYEEKFPWTNYSLAVSSWTRTYFTHDAVLQSWAPQGGATPPGFHV